MSGWLIAGLVLAAVAALFGAGMWISKRGEAKGRAETRVEVLETDAAAAERVKKAGAAARDAGTTQERLNDRTF